VMPVISAVLVLMNEKLARTVKCVRV